MLNVLRGPIYLNNAIQGKFLKGFLSNEERKAIGKLKHDELVKKLHQVQSEKKCLVILDDIWKDADWDSPSPGFPNTTRHLTEKESWELFVKKTFLRRQGTEERSYSINNDLGDDLIGDITETNSLDTIFPRDSH
ncbi:unnamed protein product [Camellia sinensis]